MYIIHKFFWDGWIDHRATTLKGKLKGKLVLKIFDRNLETQLYTDASVMNLG